MNISVIYFSYLQNTIMGFNKSLLLFLPIRRAGKVVLVFSDISLKLAENIWNGSYLAEFCEVHGQYHCNLTVTNGFPVGVSHFTTGILFIHTVFSGLSSLLLLFLSPFDPESSNNLQEAFTLYFLFL